MQDISTSVSVHIPRLQVECSMRCRRNLTAVNNVCEGGSSTEFRVLNPQGIQWITGSAFRILLYLHWLLSGQGPIIARTQSLVHRTRQCGAASQTFPTEVNLRVQCRQAWMRSWGQYHISLSSGSKALTYPETIDERHKSRQVYLGYMTFNPVCRWMDAVPHYEPATQKLETIKRRHIKLFDSYLILAPLL